MRPKFKGDMLAVDLFSGAGGLSLGFEDAGFQILYALEKDKYAAETYRHNHNGRTMLDEADIHNIEPDTLLRRLGLRRGDLDIVLGGPPCQGFSIANMRTRSRNNPENQLVYSYLDFVKKFSPKWFLMENVGGLENFDDGALKEELLDKFREIGYDADAIVIDSSRFGVPQVRKRIFFIGNRLGKTLDPIRELAKRETSRAISVREAIDDLPRLSNGNTADPLPYSKNGWNLTEYQTRMRFKNGKTVFNNLVSRNNALVVKRYKHIKQGENLLTLSVRKPDLVYNYKDMSKCHQWIYLRLLWNRPSVVISNYRKNMLIHPHQDRGLSVREAARLQSFPDTYVFHGSIGFQQQQVANAVPPLLAKSIAKVILGSA
jgi:DNA (cytosine-5)-methyltransferase 1